MRKCLIFFSVMVKPKRKLVMPKACNCLMVSISLSKPPGMPRISSCISFMPSMDIATPISGLIFRIFFICFTTKSVRKPLVEITRRALGQALAKTATISGKSRRKNGSPPEIFISRKVGGSLANSATGNSGNPCIRQISHITQRALQL